jgi:hypothetical protein
MVRWALLGLEGFRLIGRRTYCFYAWSLLMLLSAFTGWAWESRFSTPFTSG